MLKSIISVIDKFFNNRLMRRLFLILRIPATFVLIGVLLYYMKKEWFIPGLIVSVIGAIGQSWCFSCIMTQKDTEVLI